MIFDTSEKGLLTFFKPYQAALMEHIWMLNNPRRTGITSGQAFEFLKDHPDSKSRASAIFFPTLILKPISFDTQIRLIPSLYTFSLRL